MRLQKRRGLLRAQEKANQLSWRGKRKHRAGNNGKLRLRARPDIHAAGKQQDLWRDGKMRRDKKIQENCRREAEGLAAEECIVPQLNF